MNLHLKASKFFSLLYIIICLLLFSCKKEATGTQTKNNTSFKDIFEEFWIKMNSNYVYWDLDTTDWDQTYKTYKPIFEDLDINNDSDVKRSVNYFRRMTDGLLDSHYAISFNSPTLAENYIYPASDRKVKRTDFHSPFPYLSIDSGYFDRGYIKGNYVTSENLRLTALCGIINKKILYFNCNRFALQEAYTTSTNNSVKTCLQYFFSQLQNAPGAIKGVIIDVRNNQGGDVVDLNFLVGHFIQQKLQIGYSRYKSGSGRLSFTPWINTFVVPQTGNKALNIPIIVLADNYTTSIAETITMAIHTLPKGLVIGEKTWGATGAYTSNALYNDGPFEVQDFMTISESSAVFKYIDGKQYENIGFPPDISVAYDIQKLNLGFDTILEKAISTIP